MRFFQVQSDNHYEISKIKDNFNDDTFPIPIIKNSWFKKGGLEEVIQKYNLKIQ